MATDNIHQKMAGKSNYMEPPDRNIALGAIHCTDVLSRINDMDIGDLNIKSGFFKWVVRNAVAHFVHPKYGNTTPSLDVMVQRMKDQPGVTQEKKAKYIERIHTLYRQQPESPHFYLDSMQKNIITHGYHQSVSESIEIASKYGEEKAWQHLVDSVHAQESKKLQEEGIEICNWSATAADRLRLAKLEKEQPEKYKKMYYGVNKMDRILIGGQRPGMVGSIAGKTGIGKSIFLVNTGFFNSTKGLNVAHFIFENTIRQIATRYDSRLTGVPYDVLDNYGFEGAYKHSLPVVWRMFDMHRDLMGDRVRIIRCLPKATNVIQLGMALDRMEREEDFKTDVIIVDSPDLMVPVAKFDQYRLMQSGVYWELKAFVVERLLMCMGSSFVKANSSDEDPVPEGMGESYDKAKILDNMFVMIRTIAMRLANKAVIHFTKTRDTGHDSEKVEVYPDTHRMLMDTT